MKGIKITQDNPICENCGHYRNDHNSWGSECYKMIHRKERKRNTDGKYVTMQCHFQCICREFKEMKE